MKAVVCGAGIAGLAVAQRLAAQGWEVVVLEKAPGPRTQGYMIDFFGPGYDAAEAMGLLPRLHELGYRVEAARFVDAAGRTRAQLGYEQFGRTVGGRMLSIMRPDLERALREHLPSEVDLRFAASPAAIDNGPDGVRVAPAGGGTIDADLLVGCDGIHSAVRGAEFGPEREHVRPLGFHTAAFTFRDAAVHAQVADAFVLTDSIDRQIGLYGLRDGRVAAFAVHRTGEQALPEDPVAVLRAEYGSLGWVVPAALAQCPPAEEVYYDQVAQVVAPSWHRDRVVLLGDAAYAVSLLAGQGASLAVGGAFVLAEQLRNAASIEEGLARYEQAWRPVAEEKQRAGRGVVRWFLPHSAAQLRARRIMLGLARVPGFRGLVAAGVAGKHTALIAELRRSAVGSGRS